MLNHQSRPIAHGVEFPLADFSPPRRADGWLLEPARRVPILAEVDVLVLGGGPAGVCAAAAAARAGCRVLIIERYGFFGGTATAANVNVWHSLYATDGKTKIIGGLPDEIIRQLQDNNACYNTAADGETGPWSISCEAAKLVFDDIVLGSGAKVLLHTLLVDVRKEGRRIDAVYVENKSGRGAILAKTFIDCTGDADLVRRANVPTQLGNEQGGCQPPSLCFRVAGRAPDAMKLPEVQKELSNEPMDYNGEPYPAFLWGTAGVYNKDEWMLAGVRVPNINCADARDLSRAEIEGRYQLRWLLDKLRTMRGWENIHLVDIATQIGLRESHRILADHQLLREEVLSGHVFADAVIQGTYPIDIHNPAGSGITFEYLNGTRRHVSGNRQVERCRWDGRPQDDELRPTLCYQAPYRSQLPRDLDNVIVAGRCIGAQHDAAGAIRVMINAMQLGQAAGIAAALTIGDGVPRNIEVSALRRGLEDAGVPILSNTGAGIADIQFS